MASPSYTYTLTNGTSADASQVQQNFNDILNGVSDSSKDLSIASLTLADNLVVNDNSTLGSSSADDVTINGSLASTINIKTTFSYDIGSSTIGLRAIYLGSADSAAKGVNLRAGTIGTTFTYTMPTTMGTSGQMKKTDGSTATSWDWPSATIANYRRPNLTFVSVTTVDIENNTQTSNETTILFPDGSTRSVTENTGSSNKYRRFDITATAEFTSGTEDSGLRSGLSEAVNTRYAIYAVKSTINTANFVLAGDTTFPTQGNASTLNSRYGTNGWVHLGYIFNGNGLGGNSDIVSFTQCGAMTQFNNSMAGNVLARNGVLMAGTAGATTVTYTYSAGSGSTAIPDTINIVNWGFSCGSVTGNLVVKDSAGAIVFHQSYTAAANSLNVIGAASSGLQLSNGPASSIAYDVVISSFWDLALISTK